MKRGCARSAAHSSAPQAAIGTTRIPFRPERLITFAWHTGDVPRGIIADITEDLGLTRDDFYFKTF